MLKPSPVSSELRLFVESKKLDSDSTMKKNGLRSDLQVKSDPNPTLKIPLAFFFQCKSQFNYKYKRSNHIGQESIGLYVPGLSVDSKYTDLIGPNITTEKRC